jgi:hypothetical protein
MTNGQIAAIKQGAEVRDIHGNVWIARHDAFTPDRDTVNAQVAVKRGDHVAILTCKRADF